MCPLTLASLASLASLAPLAPLVPLGHRRASRAPPPARPA
jgi:hypothetical protein